MEQVNLTPFLSKVRVAASARAFLPAEARLPRFINADLIAAGLAPFAPESAAIKAG
ncbi:MAG: hypothetical protein ABIR62_08005 [Dokdonella sp.]|uniref:hypothetical protein n=1 Tax=Dokdonella sp. TaxID=2291710 RepID=UPI003263FBBD